jgi:hypothetical protein
MDVLHVARQLSHELTILEAQLREKKATLQKLWPLLSEQDRLILDSPHAPKPPAPEPAKSPPKKGAT